MPDTALHTLIYTSLYIAGSFVSFVFLRRSSYLLNVRVSYISG